MSNIGDLIVVVPENESLGLSKRWTDEQIMEYAMLLLGLEPEKAWQSSSKTSGVTGGLLSATSVALLSAGVLLSRRPTVYSSEQSVDVKLRSLLAQKELVVDLMRAVLQREELLRSMFSGTIIEQNSDQIAALRFVGTPQKWTAYKAHPFDRSFYVPVANFHDFMLHDKKAEFVRIASSLGAKSIRMVESDGQSSSAGFKAKAASPLDNVGVSGGRSQSGSQSFSLDFKNTSLPVAKPFLHENTRWLTGEPLWQAMVGTRLEQWKTEYRVQFRYLSNYDLKAEVALGLQGMGISIGGNYQEQETVSQEFIVEFWPREAYEGI